MALGALAVWGLARLDAPALWSALRRADPLPVALAAAINFAHVAIKSERWRLLLGPDARVPGARLYAYLAVSWGASMVLPQAVAEALRVDVLRRRHDVPVATSVAAVLLEKFFEALGLAVVLLPVPFVLPMPRGAAAAVLALCVGGLASGALAVALARSDALARRAARWSFWARVAPALGALRRPRDFAAALGWSVAGHALEGVMIAACFSAVGLALPFAATGVVLLGHAFALLAPVTPGRAGTTEGGICAALGVLGVPLHAALALALTYRAAQLGPMLFVLPGRRLLAAERDAGPSAMQV